VIVCEPPDALNDDLALILAGIRAQRCENLHGNEQKIASQVGHRT